MFLAVLIGWIIVAFVWQWFKMGCPLSPGIVFVAIFGMIRGVWLFVLSHSVWVVLWYALVFLSIDIVTPPFILGPEYLLAVPLGFLMTTMGVPKALAVVLAFVLVFCLAATIILIHYFYMRKFLKAM